MLRTSMVCFDPNRCCICLCLLHDCWIEIGVRLDVLPGKDLPLPNVAAPCEGKFIGRRRLDIREYKLSLAVRNDESFVETHLNARHRAPTLRVDHSSLNVYRLVLRPCTEAATQNEYENGSRLHWRRLPAGLYGSGLRLGDVGNLQIDVDAAFGERESIGRKCVAISRLVR